MTLFINACVRQKSRTKELADCLLSKSDHPYEEVRLDTIEFPFVNENFLEKRDRLIRERDDVIEAVEEVLTQICGSAWWQNSHNFETNTGLFHIEWVCQVMDEAEDPEPEPTPTPEPEEEPEEGDG